MSKNELILAGALLIWVAYRAGQQRGYSAGMSAQQQAGFGNGLGWLQGWMPS